MKTILAPIDYSKVSDNALNYAADLAFQMKAKLVLFHLFAIPVPNGEMPFVIISDLHDKENKTRIKQAAARIQKRLKGGLVIQTEALAGFNVVEEILDQVKTQKADLIVMGLTGGTGTISKTLMGSTATSAIKKAACPVLIIPEKARFKKMNSMVLACDYSRPLPQKMKPLLTAFQQLQGGKLAVLNIVKPVEAMENERGEAYQAVRRSLSALKPEYFYEVSEKFDSEIIQFIGQKKADLLVMVPHKHNLLERLFRGSKTQHTAYHTSVPLLSIHD